MKIYVSLCVCICFSILCINSGKSIPQINHGSTSPLQLRVGGRTVEIDNGIVKLSITNPGGLIKGVAYGGVGNVLEEQFDDSNRGYWDITWRMPKMSMSSYDKLESWSFRIITQSADVIEVSFATKWDPSRLNVVPLNIDKRFIMLRGVSGFYSYAIFEHIKGWPALKIDEARIAFKLQQNMFEYMAISDEKQRIMATDADRKSGQQLGYPEAVLLTNPKNPRLKGEVDDKYQYSCDNKDNHLHGWMSSHLGFWLITPSDEFRAGGPIKTDLTSHVASTCLAIFFTTHYAGPDFGVKLDVGETWKKVLGPVFIYLNSGSHNTLWQDAKRQMYTEMKKWPYNFPSSEDFPNAKQRGQIGGRLLVSDKYAPTVARSAYVGLAPPGGVGSWQDDSKGYQFWTRTDKNGVFTIRGVRAGIYNLYGWVPGVIGDFRRDGDVVIKPGSEVELGDIVYQPPRNGPTLWEIGIPDRTAAEFFIPDPSPRYLNKLFLNGKEKQYGLWDRYTEMYPRNDLSYTVGQSDYRRDWFFAHVNRKSEKNTYVPTTWKISFNLKTRMARTGNYTLRIALASATIAELQVRINNPNSKSHFTTGVIGRDNAIARHGIHGRYWLYSVNLWGKLIFNGTNTIYLRQSKADNPFTGLMYDYLRLEGPSSG